MRFAWILASAASCTVQVDFTETSYRCGAGQGCPAGFQCLDGECLSQGPAPQETPGAPTPDALAPGAGSPDAPAQGVPPGGPDAAPLDPGTEASDVVWRGYVVASVDNLLISSVTTPPIAGGAEDLYLAFVSVKREPRSVDAVTGLGLEWHPIRHQCGGRSTAALALFYAFGPAPASGPVTAELNGGVPFVGSAVLSVHRYHGADDLAPIGVVGWANSNGSGPDALCTGGTDSSAYELPLPGSPRAGSVVVVGAHTASYGTHAPGPGFTELADDQSGATADSAGVAVQERRLDVQDTGVVIRGDFGANAPDWAVIAAEIRD